MKIAKCKINIFITEDKGKQKLQRQLFYNCMMLRLKQTLGKIIQKDEF